MSYEVVIIRRPSQMGADDYHATVTRESDGEKLIFINATKWILKLRTRRWFLDRAFKRHDDYQARIKRKEVIRR